MGQRLVSYDIWDTVIRRHCHPDAIKIFTGSNLILKAQREIPFHLRDSGVLLKFRQIAERDIGRAAVREGGDDEYSIEEVMARLIRRVCRRLTPASVQALAEELVEGEVKFESKVAYLDPTIAQFFATDGAMRRIFISDFYMPKAHLIRLLDSIGAADYFHDGYVSCDHRVNKRSGRLFDLVAELECISSAAWSHIGDNRHSDVDMPSARGITCHHYIPETQHQTRRENEGRFESRTEYLAALLEPAAKEMQAHPSLPDALPLLIGFTLAIQEQIYVTGAKEAFFFTREGEFYLRLYEALRPWSPYREALPEGRLLEVSRLATFAPSLNSFDTKELMRIWNLYSTQSFKALFKTLRFDESEFEPLAARHGINLNDPIQYPWLDKRVQRFFSDDEVQNKATEVIARQRKEARNFLDDRFRGLSQGDTAVIVDVGWRGTIQDNIATLYPSFHFHGVYLGLSKLLNAQPANVSKVAFGPDLNQAEAGAELLRFVAPIEMVCNSPNGSVTGYEIRDGRPTAVRKVDENENRAFEQFSRALQDTLVSYAEQLAPQLHRDAFDSLQLRNAALAGWSNMIHRPKMDMLDAYFTLEHNETFGVGTFVNKADRMNTWSLLWLMLTRKGRQTARSRISSIGWLDGYLQWRNDHYLTRLVRLLYPQ